MHKDTGTEGVGNALFEELAYAAEMKQIYDSRMEIVRKLVARLRINISKAESNPVIAQKALQLFMAEYVFPFDTLVMEWMEKIRELKKKRVLPGLPGADRYAEAAEALIQEAALKASAHWEKCLPIFSSLEDTARAVQSCLDRARSGETIGN